MKKIVPLLIACLAAAVLPAAVSGQVDLVSRSIWRGFDLLPNNHAAIQPGLCFEFGDSGFAVDVWGSFALSGRDILNAADEVDLTFAYAWKPVSGWEANVGVIGYGYGFARGFSLKDDASMEVYATVAAIDLPLAPTLAVYYDVNLGQGFYISLGGSHEFELNETASAELGGMIGFNGGQYIERSGFSNIDAYVRVPLRFGRLTLTPSLNVMVPLLNEINEDVEIWFGVSAML